MQKVAETEKRLAEIQVVDMLPVMVEEEKKLNEALEASDATIAKLEVDLERQKSRRDQIAGALMIVKNLMERYKLLGGTANLSIPE